jgi:hypothetical protein
VIVSARQDQVLYGKVSMPTSLGNKKHTDKDNEGLGVLWIFAIITVLVFAIAGFIDIVF